MSVDSSTDDDVACARDELLRWNHLDLDEDSVPWITSHIDCFVSQSRGNRRVECLNVYPFPVEGEDDAVWEKVGQAVGNLQSLERIEFSSRGSPDRDDYDYDDYHDEELNTLDWEILARILSQVRQNIVVDIEKIRGWNAEESRLFARAIR
jgi:hypothetical protein